MEISNPVLHSSTASLPHGWRSSTLHRDSIASKMERPVLPADSISVAGCELVSAVGSTNGLSHNGTAQPPAASPAHHATHHGAVPSTKTSNSNLSLSIFPDRTFFLSGTVLTGHLELKSTANPKNLRLKSIVVDLIGEELVKGRGGGSNSGSSGGSPSASLQHMFLRKSLVIQSPELPPSDAVLGDEPADSNGYWKTKKGATQLQFAFELPATLPSSVVTKYGSIEYGLMLSVHILSGDAPIVLKRVRKVVVYEQWKRTLAAPPSSSLVQHALQTWGLFGSKGDVAVRCGLDRALFMAGSQVYVKLEIDNASGKKVSEVQLGIVRRLKSFRKSDGDTLTPIIFKRKLIGAVEFRSKEWDFGVEHAHREIILDIPLPSFLRTVRCARLLEVTYALVVTLKASFSKDIVVELPFDICHSSSFNAPPKLSHLDQIHYLATNMLSEADSEPILESVPIAKLEQDECIVPEAMDSAFQSSASMHIQEPQPPEAVEADEESLCSVEPGAPPLSSVEYVREFDDSLPGSRRESIALPHYPGTQEPRKSIDAPSFVSLASSQRKPPLPPPAPSSVLLKFPPPREAPPAPPPPPAPPRPAPICVPTAPPLPIEEPSLYECPELDRQEDILGNREPDEKPYFTEDMKGLSIDDMIKSLDEFQ